MMNILIGCKRIKLDKYFDRIANFLLQHHRSALAVDMFNSFCRNLPYVLSLRGDHWTKRVNAIKQQREIDVDVFHAIECDPTDGFSTVALYAQEKSEKWLERVWNLIAAHVIQLDQPPFSRCDYDSAMEVIADAFEKQLSLQDVSMRLFDAKLQLSVQQLSLNK